VIGRTGWRRQIRSAEYVVKTDRKEVVLRNYAGKRYRYSQPVEPSSSAERLLAQFRSVRIFFNNA